MMNTRRWLSLLLGVSLAALLAGCAGSPRPAITVDDAWVRPSAMMDRAGAAYMVIHNNSASDDRLLAVSSDVAETIELHESKEMEGMMQMSPVEAIAVPAGGSATLAPGGLHVMLIGLTRELVPGSSVALQLHFENAGEVGVNAEVREE
jgi:copper(I)-binding protein